MLCLCNVLREGFKAGLGLKKRSADRMGRMDRMATFEPQLSKAKNSYEYSSDKVTAIFLNIANVFLVVETLTFLQALESFSDSHED